MAPSEYLKKALKPESYVLGIDIGGTKIHAQLFKITGGKIAEKEAWDVRENSAKGVPAHAAQIASIIAAAQDAAAGEIVAIGVASPGRFAADGTIKPGSNPSLDRTSGEFDNVNLKTAYANALSPALRDIPLTVANDGNAMFTGMLEAIRTGRSKTLADQHGNEVSPFGLHDKHVALLGIGTGIGHAIVQVDKSGGYHFVTDGHASKLRLKVDDADWALLEKAKKDLEAQTLRKTGEHKVEIMLFPEDHTVRAEDVFRGPVIKIMAGADEEENLDLGNPQHLGALAFAGKYMARTIALIHSGQSQDVEPQNGWSDEDKKQAARTSIYLIGGGMGGSDAGKEIIRNASEELKRWRLDDAVQLVQFQGSSVAARAAATMIPPSEYKGAAPTIG